METHCDAGTPCCENLVSELMGFLGFQILKCFIGSVDFVVYCLACGGVPVLPSALLRRQQGGVLVAGPGVDNVIFLHKVRPCTFQKGSSSLPIK